MKFKTRLLLLPIVVSVAACATDEVKLNTDKDKQSYTFGFQVGTNLKAKVQDVDAQVFARGVQDAMSGAPSALPEAAMQAAMQQYQEEGQKKFMATADENKKRGEAYLAENKKQPGVKVLASGVQYKVAKEGSGKQPKATDTVTVHYRGTLINGTEFDSSYKRNQPATFPVNGVIKGWQEVLPLMKSGATWQVAIPAASAYGERGAGGAIGANETLLFDIELIAIK
jgi:FKBP-type peptidyl-prolyl cis-trans isomerase FklB